MPKKGRGARSEVLLRILLSQFLLLLLDSEAHTPALTLPDAKPMPSGPVKYPINDLDVAITN